MPKKNISLSNNFVKNSLKKSIITITLLLFFASPSHAFFNPMGMMGSMMAPAMAPMSNVMIGQMMGAMEDLMKNKVFRADMAKFILGVVDAMICECVKSITSEAPTFIGCLVKGMMAKDIAAQMIADGVPPEDIDMAALNVQASQMLSGMFAEALEAKEAQDAIDAEQAEAAEAEVVEKEPLDLSTATIKVSSTYGSSFSAANINDNDSRSAWRSEWYDRGDAPQWVVVELGMEEDIGQMTINWGSSAYATDYNVYIMKDDVWVQVNKINGNNYSNNTVGLCAKGDTVTTATLKLELLSSQSPYFEIINIEVQ
jgi:hypothetical protein